MVSLFAGGGVPGVSTRTFGRVRGRFAAWIPLGKDNELNFRAEGGAVLAGSRDGIPSKLLFRTGGSTTVRGYDFESLGVQEGDAIVPGRYYAVASVDVDPLDQRVLGTRARSSTPAMPSTRCRTRTSRWATASARACARRSARSASTSRTARTCTRCAFNSPSGSRSDRASWLTPNATPRDADPRSRYGAARLPRALVAAVVLLVGDHRRRASLPREPRPASISSSASSSRGAAARSRSTAPRARCSTRCASGASSGAGRDTHATRRRRRAHVESARALFARHRGARTRRAAPDARNEGGHRRRSAAGEPGAADRSAHRARRRGRARLASRHESRHDPRHRVRLFGRRGRASGVRCHVRRAAGRDHRQRDDRRRRAVRDRGTPPRQRRCGARGHRGRRRARRLARHAHARRHGQGRQRSLHRPRDRSRRSPRRRCAK